MYPLCCMLILVASEPFLTIKKVHLSNYFFYTTCFSSDCTYVYLELTCILPVVEYTLNSISRLLKTNHPVVEKLLGLDNVHILAVHVHHGVM